MHVIGISGQTGAGKSTFANLLSQRGLGENLEVDAIGHDLLTDAAVKNSLVKVFGADILDESGNVCRRSLGRRAFVSSDATRSLNSVMHPAMKKMVADRVEMAKNAGLGSIIINAALLFSMGLDSLCNSLIYVQADPEIRLQRLVNYRSWSEESARERLFAQDRLPSIPGVIIVDNDGDEAALTRVADQVARQLKGNGN